jgi:hypothetical protein
MFMERREKVHTRRIDNLTSIESLWSLCRYAYQCIHQENARRGWNQSD